MGWIIFGCIAGLFVGVLSLSLVFTVHYSDEFLASVGVGRWKYGLLVTDEEKKTREARKAEKEFRKKGKAAKRSGSPAKKKRAAQPEKKPEKGNVKETVQIVWDLIRSVSRPLPFLLKHFRLTNLEVNIVVGGEDAAETALTYGKLCAVVHGSLAALKSMMRVRAKRVDIFCDFCGGETRQIINFKLKIRLGVLLWAVLRMGVRFLAHTYRRTVKRASNPSGRQSVGGHRPPVQ